MNGIALPPNQAMAMLSSTHHLLTTLLLVLVLLLPISSSQTLSPSQTWTLLHLQRLLEFPSVLTPWSTTTTTSLCSLPSTPSLSLSCSNSHVTTLSITGANPHIPSSHHRLTLSANFSISSLFTTLSYLPSLTSLSLISLGLWGSLPSDQLRYLSSLRHLNLSSNYIYGQIPFSLLSLKNLTTLSLSTNLLTDHVPDLTPLSSLQHLDIAVNRLGPEWPLTTKTITTLLLNNNSFRAAIPSELRRFDKLRTLDVSSNRLSGTIPAFLFSLPAIKYLSLAGNSLSGELPAEGVSCGRWLAFVDVSRNRLLGRLPECVRSKTSNMVVLDWGNCLLDSRYQRSGSYCSEDPLAAVMPAARESGGGGGGERSKLVVVVGVVGGVVGGAIVLALVLVVLLRKNRGRSRYGKAGESSKPVSRSESALITPRLVPGDARHMSQDVRLGMLGLMPYRVFSVEELEEATNNFDHLNLMQESTQSHLYRGWLQDGSAVVIRCLRLKQKHSPQNLLHCMDAISKLRHRHLVSVLGHCIVGSSDSSGSIKMIYLVFEHVSNGTLRSHLTEWRKREMLKWPQRIAAAIGVARGIQFLHTATVPGIFGNDLSIESILLDETLTAKISNYNLPMVSKSKNNKVGPDFLLTLEDKDISSIHGDKEDVYKLGLILLEVITGKPAATTGELEAQKHQLKKILTESPREARSLTDPAIRGTFAYDSLRTAVEVTLNCLSEDHRQRPSIDDVLWNLQYSVQVQYGCASSENLSI